MQSFETRMRRVVQKENNDLQSSSAAAVAVASKTTIASSSRGVEKRRTRQRQPIQCGLIIIVLSPIVILLLIICSSRIYNTWSLSNEIELSTMLTTKEADEQEVNNKTNKNNKISNNKGLLRRKKDRKLQKQDVDKIKQQKEEEQEEEVVHKNAGNNNNFRNEQKKILVLVTSHGNIRITLRPDLSQGSVDYIHKLVESYGEGERCMHCNLYRSEKPGILQGIMENKNVVPVNTVHGSCPPDGVSEHVVNDCPEWDKNCGCHGPVMTRGSVAWAAGDAGGPDFFIDGYPEPAKWWGTQHTNFGKIEEEDSFKILDFIFTLPTTAEDGMDFLKESIHFDLRLE